MSQRLVSSERSSGVWLAAAVMLVVALGLLLPGLGEMGVWTEGEMPVLDRTRGALGEPMSGLVRHPPLPDHVRTMSYDWFGDGLGLRLPHAFAVALLAAITVGWARARGASWTISGLAGALLLSFPAMAVSGRTALGNPIGELLITLTVLTGIVALTRPLWTRALPWALLSLTLGAAAIASAGLMIGGCIPLAALALYAAQARSSNVLVERRGVRVLLWLGLVAALGTVIVLAWNQEDGYIPLLGAAKDMELMSKPQTRRFAEVLQDFGYQIFPWAGLVAMSLLAPRGRWPAAWVIAGLALAGGWSLLYGPLDLPLSVPAALAAASAVETLVERSAPLRLRRVLVLVALGGILVGRADAERVPRKVAVPLLVFDNPYDYPDEALQAGPRLVRIGSVAMLALLGCALLARRPEDHPLERIVGRVPSRFRQPLAVGLVITAGAYGAVAQAHGLIPDTGGALSLRGPLAAHTEWAESGALPSTLAVHRVRDEGLVLYGPEALVPLSNRREIGVHLQADEPRVALIREIDLAPTYQLARLQGWPLYVLHDDHATARLVSNRLPEGAQDHNPIPAVLFDEPPALEHRTRLRFEEYVEIVGWDVDGPLVRGRRHTLKLALEVLRPLPGGSKIYARFLQGRLSRINGEAQELAGDLYPPNLWREGDYILHEYEFEVPPLEVMPGTYEFVVGLRRSEDHNYDITVPEGKTNEFGVEVRGNSRHFATLGRVELW